MRRRSEKALSTRTGCPIKQHFLGRPGWRRFLAESLGVDSTLQQIKHSLYASDLSRQLDVNFMSF